MTQIKIKSITYTELIKEHNDNLYLSLSYLTKYRYKYLFINYVSIYVFIILNLTLKWLLCLINIP
jgi:hypothetical protein